MAIVNMQAMLKEASAGSYAVGAFNILDYNSMRAVVDAATELAASLKTQNHVLACLRPGVDIVTIPESLLWQMYKHPLTDIGLSQFARDSQSLPK